MAQLAEKYDDKQCLFETRPTLKRGYLKIENGRIIGFNYIFEQGYKWEVSAKRDN